MKFLIGQPRHENGICQLENELKLNKGIDIIIYPEGYISGEHLLDSVCNQARENNVTIVTSYRKDNKDRAIIIDNRGYIILERSKTLPDFNVELQSPLIVEHDGFVVGYILCMEILKGTRDLTKVKRKIDFIVHPIGVGMFSDEQFEQWIGEAINIAKTFNTFVLGTSHSDGSYRNCGISLPISYCIDKNGEPIFISKSDTRTRILDLSNKEVMLV